MTSSSPSLTSSSGLFWCDAAAMDWAQAGKAGIALRSVRSDPSGLFLGQVGFEPMARSGLHQHLGTATSFFIDGGLTDYHGSAGLHQAGINLKGATHDAIAYQRTILVSRLEAAVIYPPQAGPLHGLHAGAHHSEVINSAPEIAPEINVTVDDLPQLHDGLAGTLRQTIFDYRPTTDVRRMVQLRLRPGTRWPRMRTTALIDLWVRGGDLQINDASLHGNCFAILEPDREYSISSQFGALLICWADGAPQWEHAKVSLDPFGFGSAAGP